MGSCRPAGRQHAKRGTDALGSAARLIEPEDVLLAWLLWLPEGEDVAAAAVREIARIDRVDHPGWPLLRLRTLLADIVTARAGSE